MSICVCMHVYMCVTVYVCVCLCIYMCGSMYKWVCLYVCVYVCMYICVSGECVSMCVFVYGAFKSMGVDQVSGWVLVCVNVFCVFL